MGGGYKTLCFDMVLENYCLRLMQGDFQDLVSIHHNIPCSMDYGLAPWSVRVVTLAEKLLFYEERDKRIACCILLIL